MTNLSIILAFCAFMWGALFVGEHPGLLEITSKVDYGARCTWGLRWTLVAGSVAGAILAALLVSVYGEGLDQALLAFAVPTITAAVFYLLGFRLGNGSW
jgi:hypothetical protein